MEFGEFGAGGDPHLGVEVGQGFVEEKHFGLADDGAADRDALAVYETGRGGRLVITEDLEAAATGADVLYTDVWVSMGKEDEAAFRAAQFGRYQINAALVERARPGALVMHCLPAYRGKEISDETLEAHADTIFAQAENRLHAQKAILSLLAC